MAEYDAFAKENSDFLVSLELSEEALVRKMRLLTLMSMAEKQQVFFRISRAHCCNEKDSLTGTRL